MKKSLLITAVTLSLLGVAGCRQNTAESSADQSTSASQSKEESDASSSAESKKESKQESESKASSKSESRQAESKRDEKTTPQPLTQDIKLDLSAAWAKFTDRFPDARAIEIELQQYRDHDYQYQIEGVNATHEGEMDINAKTGEVLDTDEDRLDADEAGGKKRDKDGIDVARVLDLKRISDIAEKKAGSGHAFSWELERDDGRPVWKVLVHTGKENHFTKVTMDAEKGDILHVYSGKFDRGQRYHHWD